MNDLKDYQNELKKAEDEERNSSDGVEYFAPTIFLLIFCAVSAGATYYLNHSGLSASPLYSRTIGAQNAAVLVLFLLEGSFIALSLFGHKILKSKEQRRYGKIGILCLKVVLSLNILVSFLHMIGLTGAPLLEAYSQWGAPLTIIGAGALWSAIVTHRRKTKMRNQLLDESAENQSRWASEHKKDQARFIQTYNQIAESDEMQNLRTQLTIRKVIDQIATQCGISFAEAAGFYQQMQARKRDPRYFGPALAAPQSLLPVSSPHPVTLALSSPTAAAAPIQSATAAPSSPAPSPAPVVAAARPVSADELTPEEARLVAEIMRDRNQSSH